MSIGVLIQSSFYEAMRVLPDRERLKLFDGICEYSLNGIEPKNLSPVAAGMFILMKPNIDSTNKRYAACKENGKKGGRKPKQNQTDNQSNPLTDNQREESAENQRDNLELELELESELESELELELESEFDSESESDASAKGSSLKKEKPVKHKYGEYENVLLTDEEVAKLKQELTNFDELVQRLSEYIASTGKKYKSHYATLRTWNRREPKGKKPPQQYPEDDLSGIL